MPGTASVATLSWIPDAPGLFVTGGKFDLMFNFCTKLKVDKYSSC